MTSKTELAWAAGFFDGEGCTSASYTSCKNHRGGDLHFKVSVSQGHLEVLERFRAAVGGLGRINGPYPASKSGKDTWKFNAGLRDGQVVIGLLWPYLSSVKKAQFQRNLDWYLSWERPPAEKAVR